MRGRTLRILIGAAIATVAVLILSRIAVRFYTDVLWFAEVDYLSTFWTRIWMVVGVRAAAAVMGAGILFLNLWLVARSMGPLRVRRRYGNIEIAEQVKPRLITAIAVAVAVLGGWWLAELQFREAEVLGAVGWLRHVPWGVADPLHGRDIGFYVYTLPFLRDILGYLMLVVVWSAVLVGLAHALSGGVRLEENRPVAAPAARIHLAVLAATLLVLFGVRYWMSSWQLVVDGGGVAGSLGYTDIHARIPAYRLLAVFAVLAGASVILGARRSSLRPPVVGIGALLAAGLILGAIYPAVVQRFQVQPNELSREAPYLRWHMDFTREAFGLAGLERQVVAYRREVDPDPERLDAVLERLPLWDTGPMQRAFDATQSLRRYYGFPDADFDRYGPPGQEQQVVVGVREFQGLEPGSQTWQNLRINPLYIRGRGAVVAPARPTVEGRGTHELWIRNIEPIERHPASPPQLQLHHSSVFFGESMDGYVVVIPGRDGEFTGEPGYDYPRGIPLSSFRRVLAFAWRFGDETLLFAREVTQDSRLVFRRPVRERVRTIAPFILWDNDPLPVIFEGRVVWLLDGYTISDSYPLARALTMGRSRVRYLRNSVKAAVDAVSGSVVLYALDSEDPILATWHRMFPDLFRPLDTMPVGLRRHLRYPEAAFMARSEILQEYHLERVEAFYAGEDVWQRPQQAGLAGGGLRPYRPVRAFMPVPPTGQVEYVLSLPYIARGRQNMTAILMASNDEPRYGQLTLVEFPRDQQVQGPGQVQAMIEQDPVLAPELSLLRQRGSQIEMGKLRVLPLDSSVLYVQPLFLSADENPIPEIWGVVASNGRDVALGTSVERAVAGLELNGRVRVPLVAGTDLAAPGALPAPGPGIWSRQALELLDRAETRLRAGDWAGYGRALAELRALLQELEGETGGP